MTYLEFKDLQDKGRTDETLSLIETHVFDIPRRICEETGDENWFVCHNPITNRFEVHYAGKAFSTMEFVVPFEELDARTIEWMRRVRSSRSREIVREVSENNAKLKQDASNRAHDHVAAYAKDVYRYKDNHPSKTISSKDIVAGRME